MDPNENLVKIEGEEFEKKPEGKEFLTQELHNKAKLSSLRSYQGDMAEFIKEKNESVLSIAAKEKKRRDERKSEEEKENKLIPPTIKEKQKGDGFQVNFTILFSSLVLLLGGAAIAMYVINYLSTIPDSNMVIKNEMLPFNNTINIANISKDTLRGELSKVEVTNGISEIKISDNNGQTISKVQDLFKMLQVSPPATLSRTLKSDFALGATSKENGASLFLLISTNDFGLAFSSMLDWEKSIAMDLAFLTEQASTSTSSELLTWRDVIIKNKDTRVLTNSKNDHKIGYTFLDKNTILITNNINSIGDISSAFASRSFTR